MAADAVNFDTNGKYTFGSSLKQMDVAGERVVADKEPTAHAGSIKSETTQSQTTSRPLFDFSALRRNTGVQESSAQKASVEEKKQESKPVVEESKPVESKVEEPVVSPTEPELKSEPVVESKVEESKPVVKEEPKAEEVPELVVEESKEEVVSQEELVQPEPKTAVSERKPIVTSLNLSSIGVKSSGTDDAKPTTAQSISEMHLDGLVKKAEAPVESTSIPSKEKEEETPKQVDYAAFEIVPMLTSIQQSGVTGEQVSRFIKRAIKKWASYPSFVLCDTNKQNKIRIYYLTSKMRGTTQTVIVVFGVENKVTACKITGDKPMADAYLDLGTDGNCLILDGKCVLSCRRINDAVMYV